MRYSKKAELDFAKHNAQYEPVHRVQFPQAVHDRYLIVDDGVWLTQQQIAELFGVQKAAISKHMMNIFSSSHRK